MQWSILQDHGRHPKQFFFFDNEQGPFPDSKNVLNKIIHWGLFEKLGILDFLEVADKKNHIKSDFDVFCVKMTVF